MAVSSSPGVGHRTLVIATGHALSLALGEAGNTLAAHHSDIQQGHAEALLPALSMMLEPFGSADFGIARIVVEVGPGSFTGLRIGHAAASALALAWGAELLGVRSTVLVAADQIAQAQGGMLAVALAAPRGQIWVERFSVPSLHSLGPPLALTLEQLQPWVGQGGGITEAKPRATAALGLADTLFSPAVPLYVRPQDDAGNT